MTPPDLFPAGDTGFVYDDRADRGDTGRALAWVAGSIIVALIFGAGVWFALDRAVPVAPIVEMRP